MKKKTLVPGVNRNVIGSLWFFGIAIAFVAGIVAANLEPSANAETSRGKLTANELTTVELFERTSPSVVNIQTSTRELFRTGRRMVEERDVQGGGSGFIWDTDGHIVTNFHVIGSYRRESRRRARVEFADYIRVSLADGSSHEAQVIGYYIDRDLAILRIDPTDLNLRPISIGSSSDLRVGQDVLVIGNPFGLDSTLTKGIISAIGREIEALSGVDIYDVIQTDAAINPGNSGGPLIDSAGRLIGVNTQIKSASRSNAGIGFAIPVDVLSIVVPQLIHTGKVEWPTMGVMTIPDEIARRNNIRTGVIVRSVFPGTGASQAGIEGVIETEDGAEIRDIILAIDDKPVTGVAELQRLLRDYRRGDRVTVTLNRFDKQREQFTKRKTSVELGAEPIE